jgi:hypothetical protein
MGKLLSDWNYLMRSLLVYHTIVSSRERRERKFAETHPYVAGGRHFKDYEEALVYIMSIGGGVVVLPGNIKHRVIMNGNETTIEVEGE